MAARLFVSTGHGADIDEPAGDGGRCRHGRTDEMSPPALALTPFKIAVRRARAALAGGKHVLVHADAHAAAGLAPYKARRNVVLVLFFGLGVPLDRRRCR